MLFPIFKNFTSCVAFFGLFAAIANASPPQIAKEEKPNLLHELSEIQSKHPTPKNYRGSLADLRQSLHNTIAAHQAYIETLNDFNHETPETYAEKTLGLAYCLSMSQLRGCFSNFDKA